MIAGRELHQLFDLNYETGCSDVGLTASSKEDRPDSAAPGRHPRSMQTGQSGQLLDRISACLANSDERNRKRRFAGSFACET
jgi:hypothetical protein